MVLLSSKADYHSIIPWLMLVVILLVENGTFILTYLFSRDEQRKVEDDYSDHKLGRQYLY